MAPVEEIKSRLDIVQYIQRTVPLKKAGRVYKACCPFHSERTPSFVVNPDRQSWRCFGACAEGGDIFTFAMKQNGWTFAEALNELGKLAGVDVRPETPEQRARSEANDRLRGLLKVAADFYHEALLDPRDRQAAQVREYVRSRRGLTDETITRFGIGYAPPGRSNMLDRLVGLGFSEADVLEAGIAVRNETGKVYDRFRNRLMIPIRDPRGRVVGFGARALDPDDVPKYLNSPQTPVFDKSRLLFGLDTAAPAIRDHETVVIVEGYMDAIQAQQAGYLNVVAQMGTALTETQLKLVTPRWAKKIILALDSDAAGQTATRRSLEIAREALQADYAGRLSADIRILALPGAKDPDDLIREDPQRWAELVESAVPAADFVIEMEATALPARATLQEREAAARRLLPILVASEDDLYRKDNLQKLALKLRIAERDMLQWAAEQQKIARAKAPRASKPPEPPPIQVVDGVDEAEIYYDVSFDDLPPAAGGGGQTPVPSTRMAVWEMNCLRVLFRQPELVYHVNRKFRELAGDQESLINGPLAPLSMDDFTRADYRELIALFERALAQDDVEPLEYMQTHLEGELLREFEAILQDEWEGLRPRLRAGLSADLTIIQRQRERTGVVISVQEELLENALRLRLERLRRERQEVAYLQMEEGDLPDEHAFHEQVVMSILALHRIDTYLKTRAKLQ